MEQELEREQELELELEQEQEQKLEQERELELEREQERERMNDNELRDKLAFQYTDDISNRRPTRSDANLGFKAGWDACAEHLSPKFENHRARSVAHAVDLSTKEMEQLRAKLEIAEAALEFYSIGSNIISIYGLPVTDIAKKALKEIEETK